MFDFHCSYVIWLVPTTNYFRGRPVEKCLDESLLFYTSSVRFKVNFNTVLCRENNSVTLFSFSSCIRSVDQSQNVRMMLAIVRGAGSRK